MGALTGIIAGVAAVAGVTALYRLAGRRARALRDALEAARGQGPRSGEPVLDFELDPMTGVYRAK
ncbi:MAG: hypothetical protein VX640_03135 [Pseudomonadota bacterium]|nr:hypothetical protein [Pseudomonadota bacterium]